MICKYFLPFFMLCFHFVDDFICQAEAFYFDVVQVVDFHFCYVCFWCHIQKIIDKTDVKELTLYVFF